MERRKKAEQQGDRQEFKRVLLDSVKLPVAHLKKKPKKEARGGRRGQAREDTAPGRGDQPYTGNQEGQFDGGQLVKGQIQIWCKTASGLGKPKRSCGNGGTRERHVQST